MRILAPLTVLAGSIIVANSAVLLSTDFAGRTVSGATASNVTWTENGLSGPGSLTVTNETPGSLAGGGLFDTAAAQGHFAVSKNIETAGPWSVTIPISVSSSDVSLESIELDWQHFTNGGALQGPDRSVQWTITVTDSSASLVGTVVGNGDAASGLDTMTFGSPLSLTGSETYDVRIYVEGDQPRGGNNTGFDAITFNGEVVPEPSGALLSLLGLGLVLRRRR